MGIMSKGAGNRRSGPGLMGKQEEPTGRGGKTEDRTPDRYKMREKLLSIGDDFWIETQRGRRAYKVDGKALRLRNTLVLEEPRGNAVYEIQAKVLAVKDTMAVSKPHGRDVAVVKHATDLTLAGSHVGQHGRRTRYRNSRQHSQSRVYNGATR